MNVLRASVVVVGFSLLACDVLLPETASAPPSTPTVVGPTDAVGTDTVVLRGTRPANTALLLDDVEVIGRSRVGSFDIAVDLAAGTNRFVFVAVDAVGRRSEPVTVTVVRDGTAPDAVKVETLAPRTSRPVLFDVSIEKEAPCLVRLDGVVLPIDRNATTAEIDIDLVEGEQTLRFACVDNADNEGPVTVVEIERADIDDLFTLNDVAAEVTDSALVLTASCDGDDIVAAIAGEDPEPCAGGAWTSTTTLVPGSQSVVVTAAFAGEFDIGAETTVTVTFTPPDEGQDP